MNRRKLLGAILTAATAPAMALVAERDDTPIAQAMIDRGEPIVAGSYYLRTPLHIREGSVICGNRIYDGHFGGIHVPQGIKRYLIRDNTFYRG